MFYDYYNKVPTYLYYYSFLFIKLVGKAAVVDK